MKFKQHELSSLETVGLWWTPQKKWLAFAAEEWSEMMVLKMEEASTYGTWPVYIPFDEMFW
jgi:hypothetical protein